MAFCWMHMEAMLHRLQAYRSSGSGCMLELHKCRQSNLTVLSDLRGCLLMECHTLQRGADIGHASADQQAFGLLARFSLHDFEKSRRSSLRRLIGYQRLQLWGRCKGLRIKRIAAWTTAAAVGAHDRNADLLRLWTIGSERYGLCSGFACVIGAEVRVERQRGRQTLQSQACQSLQ